MKKTLTLLASAALMLIGGTVKAQASLTPEILYYDFNGSGTTVPNLASAPPPGTATGTINGAMSQGATSICNGALLGTGMASNIDNVNTGWTTNLTGMSWTISFRSSNIPSSASLSYIFGDVNAGGFRCFTGGVAGPGNWILRGSLTDVLVTGGASTSPSMTTFVYDMAAGNIKAYLNGVLVNTVAQTGPTISGPGPFLVGGYGSSASLFAGGLLDEFRIYSRALTPAEIAQLYNPFVTGFLGPDLNLCQGDSVSVGSTFPGNTYSWSTGATTNSIFVDSAGQYILNVSGACGSGADTINVAALLASATSISPVLCASSYTSPAGNIYSATGTYHDTLTNLAGCDSVITINLTLNQETSSSISVTTCGMYTSPSGDMYMSSGTYLDTIPNIAGCDSVITINLTLNQSSASSIAVTTCDTYVSPAGNTYINSGTYLDTIPNVAGCDSVITINLTLNLSDNVSLTAAACDSFAAANGNIYFTSGVYADTTQNMNGCDSITTYNVTITYSSNSLINVSSCGAYTAPSGAVYTTSGTYTDVIQNTAGCDSTITIVLGVTTINTAVTQNNATLTAVSGGLYQWVDCNNNFAPIAGATSQTYTATANGSYAVIITQNNCSDTSACLNVTGIGMEENGFASTLNVYPNPNQGSFFIDLGANYSDVKVIITDITGRTLTAFNSFNENLIPVTIDGTAGVYMVTVIADEQTAVISVVKE